MLVSVQRFRFYPEFAEKDGLKMQTQTRLDPVMTVEEFCRLLYMISRMSLGSYSTQRVFLTISDELGRNGLSAEMEDLLWGLLAWSHFIVGNDDSAMNTASRRHGHPLSDACASAVLRLRLLGRMDMTNLRLVVWLEHYVILCDRWLTHPTNSAMRAPEIRRGIQTSLNFAVTQHGLFVPHVEHPLARPRYLRPGDDS